MHRVPVPTLHTDTVICTLRNDADSTLLWQLINILSYVFFFLNQQIIQDIKLWSDNLKM